MIAAPILAAGLIAAGLEANGLPAVGPGPIQVRMESERWPQFAQKLGRFACAERNAAIDRVDLDPAPAPAKSLYFRFTCSDGRQARVLCGEAAFWKARGANCVLEDWLDDFGR